MELNQVLEVFEKLDKAGRPAIIVLFLLGAFGCGQKGDLYLPPDAAASSIEQSDSEQKGSEQTKDD